MQRVLCVNLWVKPNVCSGNELAGGLVPVQAGGLEEADGGLQGGVVALLLGHVVGVDGIAVHIDGEGGLVALVGRTRGGPGGVGDRVLDDGGGLAVVAVHDRVAVDGEEGGEALAEVLGGLAARLAVHADVLSADAYVAVAEVVDAEGGDDVAGELAVGVVALDVLNALDVEVRVGDVEGGRVGGDAAQLVGSRGLLEQEVLGLGLALPVVLVGLEGDDAVLIGCLL